MTKLTFNQARFLTSAVKPKQYPMLKDPRGQYLPEIAVAGRSNVGKSTLINHLFGKGLARTSSTPGKTQLLNFFCIDESLIVTDLPGYGYAKVPMKVREQWGPMIQEYLEQRENLKLLLFLIDIRHVPNEEDFMLAEWVAAAGKKLILVLTKVDKVTTNERNANRKKIIETFPSHFIHDTVVYSSTKNVGRRELIGAIQRALFEEPNGTY